MTCPRSPSVLSSSSYCCSPQADTKQAVRVLRYIGGGAALLFAVFLAFAVQSCRQFQLG
jgi:hypothetical protein